MPEFEFTSPEGKTYSISGPDGATKEQAFQMLQQHLGAGATSPQPAERSPESVGIGSQVKAVGKAALESLGEVAGGIPGAAVGAEIGGALGALGGPAAPVTVPAGMVVGGLAGGWLGGKVGGAAQSAAGQLVPENVKESTGFSEEQRAQERKAMPGATLAGELIPALASLKVPTKAFSEGTNKLIANLVWEKASPVQQKALKIAEARGLKIAPSQVQEGASQRIIGTANNQKAINNWAGELTGATKVPEKLDRPFIEGRLKELGSDYEAVYANPLLGKELKLNDKAAGLIRTALDASVFPLPATARKILEKITPTTVPAPGTLFGVRGKDLKTALSEINTAVSSTEKGPLRNALRDFSSQLQQIAYQVNPAYGAVMKDIDKKYAATATLRTALRKGIIDVNGNLDANALGGYLSRKYIASPRAAANPLRELGEVGQALGISSVAKGSRKRGADTTVQVELPVISPFLRTASKAAGKLPDSAAGKMVQQKARGLYGASPAESFLGKTIGKTYPTAGVLASMMEDEED